MKPVDTVEETDQDEALAFEAYKEMEEAPKKPWEKAEEKPEEEPKEAEEAEEESKESEEKPEESEEEPEKPSEEESNAEEKPTEEAEPEVDDPIRTIAEKEKLTIDEAKEIHEARNNLVEKYKNPYEMAKALQSTQSAYDKLKNETPKPEVREVVKGQMDMSTVTNKQYEEGVIGENGGWEKVIDTYREKEEDAYDMTDDDIKDHIKGKLTEVYTKEVRSYQTQIKTKAEELRDQMLDKIPEESQDLLPEIKKTLKETPDKIIAGGNYDIRDVITYVRGEKYTPEYVKGLLEKEYKRGLEAPKILGEKAPKDHSAPSKKSEATSTATFSGAQKQRATEMFPDTQSEEESLKLWKDVYSEELKKNPKFVG